MQIEIFNVNHGQCAVVTFPNGRRLMIDCGDRVENGRFWAPCVHYAGQAIDLLALMNLDEDHVSNFDLVLKHVRVPQILSNPTVGASELRALKPDGMRRGVAAVFNWMNNPYKGPSLPAPDFSPARIWWYFNPYAHNSSDSNNLSLILFIQYGSFKIVFTGDMELKGWRQLLGCQPALASDLWGTNIFVASHHGRINGYSAELFQFFKPEIVIISDGVRQFDTQETDALYRQHCLGATVVANPLQRRFVVTTRNDGDMRINVSPDGSWILNPVSVPDWELKAAA